MYIYNISEEDLEYNRGKTDGNHTESRNKTVIVIDVFRLTGRLSTKIATLRTPALCTNEGGHHAADYACLPAIMRIYEDFIRLIIDRLNNPTIFNGPTTLPIDQLFNLYLTYRNSPRDPSGFIIESIISEGRIDLFLEIYPEENYKNLITNALKEAIDIMSGPPIESISQIRANRPLTTSENRSPGQVIRLKAAGGQ